MVMWVRFGFLPSLMSKGRIYSTLTSDSAILSFGRYSLLLMLSIVFFIWLNFSIPIFVRLPLVFKFSILLLIFSSMWMNVSSPWRATNGSWEQLLHQSPPWQSDDFIRLAHRALPCEGFLRGVWITQRHLNHGWLKVLLLGLPVKPGSLIRAGISFLASIAACPTCRRDFVALRF